MRRGILVGGACFLLGAISLALAQTTAMRPDQFVAAAWTWTGVQTFADGKLSVGGATSGNSVLKAPATGGGTVTLPVGTGTLGFGGGAAAMTLISTQTAANSASLQWTGLGASYNTYKLECSGISPQTNNTTDAWIQFGEGATPTWETSAGYTSGQYTFNSTGTGATGDTNAGHFTLNWTTHLAGVGSQGNFNGSWTIENVPSSSLGKNVFGAAQYKDGSAVVQENTIMGGIYNADTNPITAVRMLVSSGNIASGQCSLYGLTP